jgi:two-component system chemotaxis response regulator CheY
MQYTWNCVFSFLHIRLTLPANQVQPAKFRKEMKILIADDNRKFRRLVRDYLPAACDEIFECDNGKKAVEVYERYQPDWVLMDWEMPEMNGISAIRRIVSQYPQARICMVTAFDEKELRGEAIRAGASSFVLKDNLYELENILSGV